ncbi:C4-dicarboxylate TRAP transporter substrate-binding protein [Sporomusa sp. KB1]|uniref:C4-dicarboxylate TRAP transporter substrate-binding protein n=1 Tax=Sporomusa sp. KB1 TaxID=943346 RepID=UPI0011A3A664|nr:C4-dicarboxylate TRAP transporter substrate-binding protein [Sporomusa sp. KB1]TWH47270.1 tripartite ATP-independent transporter DctP family solute receptor [Sporomusa sp. KB1]
MERVRKIPGILLGVLILSLTVAACTSAPITTKQDASQVKYVLKFNHVLTESETFHKGFMKWAQRVGERTNGGLEIQVFHSAQLGLEENIIEQLRQGAPLGLSTDSARLGMYVPEIAVINAPYFLDSIDDVAKLKELFTIKQWAKELEEKYGIKIVSFNWVQGPRHMVSNRPIRNPGDMQGLRIRVPGAPVWQQTMRSFGAEPVALPFGEVYIGMEQKEVEGADLVYRNVTEAKLFEVARYMSETRHILLINFEVVSKQFFDSLPPEYQKILIEECDKAGTETSQEMEKEVAQLKTELTQKGMIIVEDVNVVDFRRASEETYEVLQLTNIRDKLYEEMGKK